MVYVNVYDAKTNLSRYLDVVNKNHEVVIICKNGVPVAQLVEYKPNNKRILGLLKGQIEISDDFDSDLPDEIMKYFK